MYAPCTSHRPAILAPCTSHPNGTSYTLIYPQHELVPPPPPTPLGPPIVTAICPPGSNGDNKKLSRLPLSPPPIVLPPCIALPPLPAKKEDDPDNTVGPEAAAVPVLLWDSHIPTAGGGLVGCARTGTCCSPWYTRCPPPPPLRWRPNLWGFFNLRFTMSPLFNSDRRVPRSNFRG